MNWKKDRHKYTATGELRTRVVTSNRHRGVGFFRPDGRWMSQHELDMMVLMAERGVKLLEKNRPRNERRKARRKARAHNNNGQH